MGTAIVLSATYLYNTQPETVNAKPLQLKIPESESEKKNSESSYFDIQSVAPAAKTPLRGEALSSSRPNTPTIERKPHRIKSSELRIHKREQ